MSGIVSYDSKLFYYETRDVILATLEERDALVSSPMVWSGSDLATQLLSLSFEIKK
jgi:hypothetical protein